jgi:hypothetical protein
VALVLRPDSLAAHEALAGCLLVMGRPAEARPHLTESLKHQHSLRAYILEARCLIALGKLDDAEKVCTLVRRIYGDNPPLSDCYKLLRQKRAGR